MTAADDGDGTRQRQSRDQYTPGGSTRSAALHIRFATVTAVIWVDLGFPWRGHAGRIPHRRTDHGRGRDSVGPRPIRRPQ
jgi:hypothetical protein